MFQFSVLRDSQGPADGSVFFLRGRATWSQRPPRATRGGNECGAGAPAVRPQHVVRVEESRAGGLADRKSDESGEQATPEEPAYGST